MQHILMQIIEEYERASRKFPTFNSAHEGYAVLKEEVDELWDKIKKKGCPKYEMQKEAVQIAAMAIRFILDVTDVSDNPICDSPPPREIKLGTISTLEELRRILMPFTQECPIGYDNDRLVEVVYQQTKGAGVLIFR